jgi:hypothetical protein
MRLLAPPITKVVKTPSPVNVVRTGSTTVATVLPLDVIVPALNVCTPRLTAPVAPVYGTNPERFWSPLFVPLNPRSVFNVLKV